MKPGYHGWYYHPYEIAISGFKNSGKTTLLQKLIAHFRQAGLSIACLKNDAHYFELDHPGRDTHSLKAAGAAAIAIQDKTHSGWIIDHILPPESDQILVEQAFLTYDALLVEGRKHSPLPKLLLLDDRGEMTRHLEELAATAEQKESHTTRRAIQAIISSRDLMPDASSWAAHLGLPCFERDDVVAIADHIQAYWRSRVTPLRALILAGGRSTRMGADKAQMRYGDRPPELRRLTQILAPHCHSVHVSCRPDQHFSGFTPSEIRLNPAESDDKSPLTSPMQSLNTVMHDTYHNLGPLGGLLTALDADPRAAWLVVSCDLPLLEERDIQYLVSQRRPQSLATAYTSLWDGVPLPEPLCAIWEPKSRSRLLGFWGRGVNCPRWVLRAGGAHYVEPPRPEALLNANRPEDRRQALRILGHHGTD